ncbi:mucin-binding protein, partial [Secundilactobacillus folii]|uniref:mucin-binding protein n=1 Tax=Secundilactobacillus folii TaxID=2678357 RepID=UPI003CCDD6BC
TPVNPDNPNGPKLGDYQSETHATVTETVHYVKANGDKVKGDDVQSLDFTRSITVDAVTGKVLTTEAWTPVQGTEFTVITPAPLAGYTVDPTQIEAVTGVSGDTASITKTVTYTPDTNTTATVTYHDDTENKDV